MKIRKTTPEENHDEPLCEFVLETMKNISGKIIGYDLCEHRAKWKAGRTFYCGWHVPKPLKK